MRQHVFSLGDLFKGLIGPSAAGAGGALKNAMNSTTMDSQQRKIGGRKFDKNSRTNNPVKNIDPEMLRQRQPLPYAQKRPMRLTEQGGPGLESLMFANSPNRQYEDEALMNGPQGYSPMNADIANFINAGNFNQQRNTNPMLQVNPMGFTNRGIQEAPDPRLYLEDYRNRLRVR